MELKITGLEEIERNLLRVSNRRTLENNVRRSARKAMSPILDSAKALVPVDEGDLKRSLILSVRKVRGGNISARVGPDTKTVVRLDDSGTIDFGRKKRPANYAHLVEGGTGEASPKPFLRPAFERHAKGAVDTFGKEMQKGLERAIKRSGGGA